MKYAAPFIAAVFAATPALADTLDVKLGLWETTSTTQTTGMAMPEIPPEVLSQMPPDQRAQVEAMMKGSPMSDTMRHCVTQQDLEDAFKIDQMPEENCKHTVVTSTSKLQEAKLECTGEQAGSGTFRVEAVNNETVKGAMDMRMGSGQDSMAMKSSFIGKWLGAECGDVKPMR